MQRQLPSEHAELVALCADPLKVHEVRCSELKTWKFFFHVIGSAGMDLRFLDNAFRIMAPVIPVSGKDEVQLRGMVEPARDFAILNMTRRGIQSILEPDRVEVVQKCVNQLGIASQKHNQRLEPSLCERPIYKEAADRR